MIDFLTCLREVYPEGHDASSKRYADGYNDASKDIMDHLGEMLQDAKPFGFWVKYANGYEEFIQRLPTDVDCEDMPSSVKCLYLLDREVSPWETMGSAPKDGTSIIAYSPSAGVVLTSWGVGYTGVDGDRRGWRDQDSDGVERVFWNYEGLEPCTPTHWMPLPEPPK